MIVVDELPFKFVERDGFRTFMAAAESLFKIPSCFTVSRDCYQLYLDENKKLQNWFKKTGQSVCITTDTWTSLIIANVFSITIDNANSNDTCVTYLKTKLSARECAWAKGKYLHMKCIAHIINLFVVDGLKEINESIKKAREAIRWVRNSPARLAKFRDCCEDENIECKSLLCLDVPTRWNSTYLMLEVAQKFEKAFERFEIKDLYFKDELSEGVPTITDWENARMMVDILSIFYELTLRISGSLYVTSNEFYHEISSVNCSIKEWMGSGDANVKAMGERMKAKYDKYWGDHRKMNKLIYIAVVLDPRYKLEFIDYACREKYGIEDGPKMAVDIKEALLELFEVYKLANQSQDSSQEQNVVSTQSSQQEPSIKMNRFVLEEKFKRHKIESGEVENKCEVDIYLKDSVLVKDNFDILKWWDVNQSRYPIIALLA